MTDQPDYPAAHSMDTMWFAVDRDGHVAMFSSGEAGAVPKDAYIGEEGLGMLDVATATSEPVYVREARLRKEGDAAAHLAVIPKATAIGGALVFVDERAVVDREVATGHAREVRATTGFALRYPAMSLDDHARLHGEGGGCRGCSYEFAESPAAASGFYQYEHSTDNWVAGPYVLEVKPARPLREEALPEELRGHVVRLDACFEDTPSLQPVERWDCEAWGAAYLSGDGAEVRPIPGKEKEYAAEVETLGEVEGYAVQPADPAWSAKPWWKFW